MWQSSFDVWLFFHGSSRATAGLKSGLCMDSPTPSRTKRSGQKNTPTIIKKLNNLNSAMGVQGRIMMPPDENRDSSYVTTAIPFLTTRATIDIGTWNVRKMLEYGSTSQIATEMRR